MGQDEGERGGNLGRERSRSDGEELLMDDEDGVLELGGLDGKRDGQPFLFSRLLHLASVHRYLDTIYLPTY